MEKEIKQCLADIRDFCGDLKSKLVAAIEDTGWKTLNSQIQYRRKNGVVYVVGTSEGSKALTAKQYTTVGTLPVSFKPSIQINGFGVDAYGGTGNDFTSFITTDGEIKIYANNGTTYWRFATSFPAGGGYCIRKIGGALYEIAHHLKGYIKCIKDTARQKEPVLLQSCNGSKPIRKNYNSMQSYASDNRNIFDSWRSEFKHKFNEYKFSRYNSGYKLLKAIGSDRAKHNELWRRNTCLVACGSNRGEWRSKPYVIWICKFNLLSSWAINSNKAGKITPRGGVCYG